MSQNHKPGRSRLFILLSAVLGSGLVILGLALFNAELTIRTTGLVHARGEARLYAPFSGIIARHNAMLGQYVRAGDILLELDDAEIALLEIQLEREIAETEAAIAQQEIALRKLAICPAPRDMATAIQRKERLAKICEIHQEIEALCQWARSKGNFRSRMEPAGDRATAGGNGADPG
jgi:multidrug resistance efflux pump